MLYGLKTANKKGPLFHENLPRREANFIQTQTGNTNSPENQDGLN
jgi:hypothetical protein